MWDMGTIRGYFYEAKFFEEPSKDYGIDGGCISKLHIRKDRKTYANYDRGWDVLPQEEVRDIYEAILEALN